MGKKRGGKTRKRGKRMGGQERKLVYKDDNLQEYAEVTKMLGNGRLRAFCYDGKERMCKIRGSMIRKVWINAGDIIIIALRDYQDHKADVIHKYNNDEVRQLQRMKILPSDKEVEKMKNPSKQIDDDSEIVFDDV